MATITLGGNEIHTKGNLPEVGSQAPDFTLIKSDLSKASLKDFAGTRVILNIFPSIDTDVCATSVRNFNKRATELDNTQVLCVSRDTPFAMKRFSDNEETKNVTNLSDIKDSFGKLIFTTDLSFTRFGFLMKGVIYNQQVPEIGSQII
jgi:thiol peroxidase